MGETYARLGQRDDMVKIMGNFAEAMKVLKAYPEKRFEYYAHLGQLKWMRNVSIRAAHFDEVIKLCPEETEFIVYKALCLVSLGNYEKAKIVIAVLEENNKWKKTAVPFAASMLSRGPD